MISKYASIIAVAATLGTSAFADELLKPGLKCDGFFTEEGIDIPINLESVNQVRKDKKDVVQYFLVSTSAGEQPNQFAIQNVDIGATGEVIVRGSVMQAGPSVYKLTVPAKEGEKSELIINKMRKRHGETVLEKRFEIKLNCRRVESRIEELK